MDFLECCHGHGEQTATVEPECCVSGRVFDSEALTIDHLTSTPLFDAILQGDWNGVDFLLRPNFLPLQLQLRMPQPFEEEAFQEETSLTAKEQAATWIVCNDEEGKYLWRQLPIHAAICYGAPLSTIEGLVKVYPDGLCNADTNGNLPLHLAINFKSSEKVVLHILKAFPEAIHAENGDKKLPLQCGAANMKDEGTLSRIHLLQTFMDCKKILVAKECESKRMELEALSASASSAAEELEQAKAEHFQTLQKEAPQKRKFGFRAGSWRKRSNKVLAADQ